LTESTLPTAAISHEAGTAVRAVPMTTTANDSEEFPASAASPNLAWSDARLVGYTPMDETHKEFYRVVQHLLASSESALATALEEFEHHAVEHFQQEDGWMRDTGFPAQDCHIEEHEAVLKSTREVREAVAEGRAGPALVHDFAMTLIEWFPGHADYLDSALAAWMSTRTLGGKPVVLKRNATRSNDATR
jgi:hemerythrin